MQSSSRKNSSDFGNKRGFEADFRLVLFLFRFKSRKYWKVWSVFSGAFFQNQAQTLKLLGVSKSEAISEAVRCWWKCWCLFWGGGGCFCFGSSRPPSLHWPESEDNKWWTNGFSWTTVSERSAVFEISVDVEVETFKIDFFRGGWDPFWDKRRRVEFHTHFSVGFYLWSVSCF